MPTRSFFRLVILVASVSVAAVSAHGCGHASIADDPLSDLQWLEGSWISEREDAVSEERWTRETDAFIGRGRTLAGGALVASESMRIEARGSAIVFIASPSGQETTEFALTESSPRSARFENTSHDFPTSIRYWREGDVLRAEVDGPDHEPTRWTFALQPD